MTNTMRDLTAEERQKYIDAISTQMRSIAEECDESLQYEYDVLKLALVNPDNILAIAEAFRALEQRAEAAEAIVSDVNEIIGLLSEREWAEHCTKTETGKLLEELITELHDDASPAADLAELVPDEIPGAFVYHGAKGAFDAGKSAGWNACRDEVLKNIEGRESEEA